MSISGKLAMTALKLFFKKLQITDVEKELEKCKQFNEKHRFVMPKDKKAYYELIITAVNYPCLVIRSRKRKSSGKAVLFIYGGINSAWKKHLGMARRYADNTGADIWFPIYPSVSEVNITKSIDVLYEAYKTMMSNYDASKTVIVGNSFGGTFAMELINWNNRKGVPLKMPALIIAHSPGGVPDTDEDWKLMESYADKDPVIDISLVKTVAELTAHGEEVPKHAISPVYEDFHNAPPTYMYYAEEILAANAEAYKRAFKRDGVGDRLHISIEKNMMHSYSSMPIFPESKKAYYEGINLINEI